MGRYDEQLRQLDAQMQQKQTLREETESLERQRDELEKYVWELDLRRTAEKNDVEKLDQTNLKSLYYRFSGKMEEKRALEQAEAEAAESEYTVQKRKLTELEREIENLRQDMSALHGCEQRYQQLLAEKTDAILRSAMPEAAQIREIDRKTAVLTNQADEIREAVSAGQKAMRTADAVWEKLDGADGWATWDLFGGGMISDLAKYSNMDAAQSLTLQLQADLQRFQTELSDVKVTLDTNVNVDGFLRFADYFFDGIIADWAVKDRIGRSKEQLQRTRSEIGQALRGLENMLNDNVRACEDARRLRRRILLEAEVE